MSSWIKLRDGETLDDIASIATRSSGLTITRHTDGALDMQSKGGQGPLGRVYYFYELRIDGFIWVFAITDVELERRARNEQQ